VGRTSGPNFTPTNYATFAPAFLAGIGRMPDTIEDRAVVIQMRRKAANEYVQPYRPGRDRAALNEIRDRLSAWAEANTSKAHVHANEQQIDLPVDDRAADVWEPLLVVAHLAGGDWPVCGRAACIELVAKAGEADTDASPGQLLLEDIHAVMNVSFMASASLCAALNDLPESPWADIPLNSPKLGQRLRPYEIKTRHSTDKSKRGYHRVDFDDAWRRYVPQEPSETVQSVQQPDEQEKQPDDLAVAEPSGMSKPSGQTETSAATPDASDTCGQFSTHQAEPHDINRCPDCETPNPFRHNGECVPCIANRHAAGNRKETIVT
jgi:hypothetical protein